MGLMWYLQVVSVPTNLQCDWYLISCKNMLHLENVLSIFPTNKFFSKSIEKWEQQGHWGSQSQDIIVTYLTCETLEKRINQQRNCFTWLKRKYSLFSRNYLQFWLPYLSISACDHMCWMWSAGVRLWQGQHTHPIQNQYTQKSRGTHHKMTCAVPLN